MAVRPQTINLYQAIRSEFERLSNIKEFGVTKYSTDWMLHYVAHKYFKSPKTVENIVFNRVHYTDSSDNAQQSLF